MSSNNNNNNSSNSVKDGKRVAGRDSRPQDEAASAASLARVSGALVACMTALSGLSVAEKQKVLKGLAGMEGLVTQTTFSLAQRAATPASTESKARTTSDGRSPKGNNKSSANADPAVKSAKARLEAAKAALKAAAGKADGELPPDAPEVLERDAALEAVKAFRGQTSPKKD